MYTEELKKFLMDELKKEVEERWNTAFEESGPPQGQISTETIAQWLWIKARIVYEGATTTPSTDRASGDPESAHAWWDWIGLAESAPASASVPADLDNWALFSTNYRRTYRDIQVPGPWGIHSGRWVEALSEEGIVQVRVVTGTFVSRNRSWEQFRDVEPEDIATIEYTHLKNKTE